ncbi:hypothetical protein HMPREF0208_02715 [Citrobacter koseri]|uniref:Uncharacterized protein n=1 Tax=Citrobacter koseri (strain ATCC BAA-895 / CDC 4225-83 / SGSC4696) TaxID=290338 RepID=A8AN84_CITK8|nr:hypothetical protein CKO_03871 [Citrobacter koseri ATCC BAA-895]KWZ95765.1 hypothetical protein HMPREF3220_03946 [Citrobacter koseri]KXA03180.1 hypothetical protein HMPREF3207_01970 [Citrobacter koseri]KXB43324.1 hypothetical protein HMPREF0208_02715 [Citrobacter koseri]
MPYPAYGTMGTFAGWRRKRLIRPTVLRVHLPDGGINAVSGLRYYGHICQMAA